MFNLQGSELIIILLLALVVLGPEKLPEAMRRAGQFYAELKKMSSGFQQEFKAVMDEPMKEVRDTANLLRDSADFRTFQDGDRPEKPKSAEMVAAPDPTATPVEEVPTFEGGSVDPEVPPDAEPERAPDPFANAEASSAAPREADPPPEPFSGEQASSAAPPPADAAEDSDEEAGTPAATPADEPTDDAHEEPTG